MRCIVVTQYVARNTIVITSPITKVFTKTPPYCETSPLEHFPYQDREPMKSKALRRLIGWIETSWMGLSNNFISRKHHGSGNRHLIGLFYLRVNSLPAAAVLNSREVNVC